MNVEKRSSTINSSFVHLAQFYINGFHDFPHGRYFYIFLCFVYIITVFGNVALILIIFQARSLHTPKYIIVFNLALTDLCGSTALIPKLLDTFLFEKRYIDYEACVSYMFFVLFFGGVQSWTLTSMAYDRLIAICFPFHYHKIVTNPAVVVMIVLIWLLVLGVVGSLAGLLNRLSFCNSLVIQSFYCDHGPVFRLACNSFIVNQKVARFATAILIFFPCGFIALTYVCIGLALRKFASRKERLKALGTCTSHLMLVTLCFFPIISTNIAVYVANFQPNTRMINSTLTHTVPSLLNPFIYSLKTEEVLIVIRKLLRRFYSRNRGQLK